MSAPPTILSPSPVRPFSISIMVSRPLPTLILYQKCVCPSYNTEPQACVTLLYLDHGLPSPPYINTVPEVCLPLLQYWVPALCDPSLSRSWSPVPSLHKYCTRSVSAPPTILSPSPVRPFSISIVVSRPGMIGHVRGSAVVSSLIVSCVSNFSTGSVEDSPKIETCITLFDLYSHYVYMSLQSLNCIKKLK